MSANKQRQERHSLASTTVPHTTLTMLAALLQAAFRMHCTDETIAGRTAWQLIHEVRLKLADLSHSEPILVSEERLAEFVDNELATPALKLAEVA